MVSRLRRWLKWSVLTLVIVALMGLGGDALHLDPAREAAAPYTYDIVRWHLSNFLSKWFHRAARTLPWNSVSREDRQLKVEEYFQAGQEVARLKAEVDRAAAKAVGGTGGEVDRLEQELEQVMTRRKKLRNDVEEVLESTVSSIVVEEGLGSWGGLLFPPVDVRLGEPPKLLVTSPRDRILRTHNVLIRPGIKAEEREEAEDTLLEESNLSALVTDIGGVATYPASVPGDRSLEWTLQIGAHEWLHHYFFFRPLGQNIFDDADIQTLNETVADIAGREIGDRAFLRLGGVIDEPESAGLQNPDEPPASDEERFEFDAEMRETRLRVDGLLAQGKVEEAEAYMEERRRLFLENGFHIRKLNQAYFAFHGTYAESPSSVSPIDDQLQEFRELVPDLGSFVRTMAGMSSYREFLETLRRLREQAEPSG